MAKRPARGFTVADGLILVAALAVGLAWMRQFQGSEAGGEIYPHIDPDDPVPRAWHVIQVGA